MKKSINFKKIGVVGIIITLFVSWVALACPVGEVSAAYFEQTPPPPVKEGAQSTERLEKAYKALTRQYEFQGKQLEKADGFITRIEDQIKIAKENGKDVSKTIELFEKFKAKINDAKIAYKNAGEIMKVHAGFDANGKITDPQKAFETLKEARQNLAKVEKNLRPAMSVLYRKVGEFLKKYLPKK